jgi:hypothetical protein
VRAARRALPLLLALLAAYSVTLAVDDHVTPAERHRLLLAESIATDGDVDVGDDARGSGVRAPAPTEGRRLEPVGIGFGALMAPAYAIGGATGVRLWLAALTALAFCFAAALGRRLVPEPWATRAALVTGLSPPALGAACAISPEGAGGALLAGAALLALRVREDPRGPWAFWCAALLGAAPWLAQALALPATVIALALARWLRRRRRGLASFVALEVVLISIVVYVTVHERLFGRFTPHGSDPTGADGLAEHLERWPRAAGLWLDRDIGLLLWAPFAALAFVALFLLWRSRRDRLAIAVSDQVDVEVTATFLALVAGAVVVVAVFLAPLDAGPWFPGRQLVPALPFGAALAAWGLRFAPRAGALLTAATLAASIWLLIGADTLRPVSGGTPWGGAERAAPHIRHN